MHFNWGTLQFEEKNAHKPQLHDLIKDKPSADDVQALIKEDPNAVKKKKGKDGLLPLHTAILNHVSVEVIHVL